MWLVGKGGGGIKFVIRETFSEQGTKLAGFWDEFLMYEKNKRDTEKPTFQSKERIAIIRELTRATN